MKVLFLCTGNICRSPMAAAFFGHHASRNGMSHVVVDSAGTLGIIDSPASLEAVQALKEIGVDLSQHRSKGFDTAAARTSDLIIAMSQRHLQWLSRQFPDCTAERWLVRAFERGPKPEDPALDLADPIGQSLERYRETREILVRCLEHLGLYLRYHEGDPQPPHPGDPGGDASAQPGGNPRSDG